MATCCRSWKLDRATTSEWRWFGDVDSSSLESAIMMIGHHHHHHHRHHHHITQSLSSSPPSSTTLNKTLPSWRRKLMAALGAGKTDACRAANHFNEGWVGVGGAVFLKMMIMIIIIMKLIWYYDSIVLWLQWPTLLCCYSSSRRTHCWRQSTASARSTAENYLEKKSGTEKFIFWRELPDFLFRNKFLRNLYVEKKKILENLYLEEKEILKNSYFEENYGY